MADDSDSAKAVAARRKRAAMAGHTGDRAQATHLLGDTAPVVRIAALRSLARLDELLDEHLAGAFADPVPAVRIAALELAAVRPSPRIDHLLHDTEAMVVESAAWAIGERPSPTAETIDVLVNIAGDHEDPLVREAAVAALGAIGDKRGLPAVLAATHDKPAIRRRAVVSLVAFEGPEVDAAWARARDDRDRQVRDAVDELLGSVDDEAD